MPRHRRKIRLLFHPKATIKLVHQCLRFFSLALWLVMTGSIALAQSAPLTQAQKFRSQADALEDKATEAIDEGQITQGLDLMVQAIRLDPSSLRFMNYGSVLFGNGVAAFKESGPQKGTEILREAEAQLHKAIEGFDPNKDQVYLSQCYFLLGEMYRNAFDDKMKAREYYQKAASLNDYTGARDALNKL